MIEIKKNSIVLFQGDSVTDCHRNRNDVKSMGESYVKLMNEYLNKFDIQVINKGIAGNKVNNLLERFDNDFKEVKHSFTIVFD